MCTMQRFQKMDSSRTQGQKKGCTEPCEGRPGPTTDNGRKAVSVKGKEGGRNLPELLKTLGSHLNHGIGDLEFYTEAIFIIAQVLSKLLLRTDLQTDILTLKMQAPLQTRKCYVLLVH